MIGRHESQWNEYSRRIDTSVQYEFANTNDSYCRVHTKHFCLRSMQRRNSGKKTLISFLINNKPFQVHISFENTFIHVTMDFDFFFILMKQFIGNKRNFNRIFENMNIFGRDKSYRCGFNGILIRADSVQT